MIFTGKFSFKCLEYKSQWTILRLRKMGTFLKFLAKEKLGVFTRKGPVLCKYTRPDTLLYLGLAI